MTSTYLDTSDGDEGWTEIAVLHHRPHVAHTTHVPVVERHPVLQRQRGEVRILLEEDEVPLETELHGFSEQAACEALTDGGEITGLGDIAPDLRRLLAHDGDGVVGVLEGHLYLVDMHHVFLGELKADA